MKCPNALECSTRGQLWAPVEEGLAACISRRLGEKDGNSQNEAMPEKVYLLSVMQSLTNGDRQRGGAQSTGPSISPD